MEFEGLDEKVEWEARRVAAAFGVEEWHRKEQGRSFRYRGLSAQVLVEWLVAKRGSELSGVYCGPFKKEAKWFLIGDWSFVPSAFPQCNELLARGLYRLGFEENEELALLVPFTAHEKLELRLSMPREFWPKTWLEEEGAG